jgi:hypothetical protein
MASDGLRVLYWNNEPDCYEEVEDGGSEIPAVEQPDVPVVVEPDPVTEPETPVVVEPIPAPEPEEPIEEVPEEEPPFCEKDFN